VFSNPRLGGRSICESVAGLGEGSDAALRNGLEKFEADVMHPLVAGLIDASVLQEQVQWEELGEPGAQWRACNGGILRQGEVPAAVMPRAFIDPLLAEWVAGSPPPEVHWLRWNVMMRGPDRLGSEVFVDNQPWGVGTGAPR